MGKFIRLKKGFTINLKGKAAPKVVETDQPETFVIKPTDFFGLYMPKVVVNVGDTVKAGSPLFHDKKYENILFTAPVSGEVVEVKRGEKRKLLEIKILADKKVEFEVFKKYSVSEINNLGAAEIKDQLLQSGIWPSLVQRPFGVVADPATSPSHSYFGLRYTSLSA